ncbi:bifunctional DNA-formamidopyrimidine glycosylase/DNA-(apurinic or apyrimidinic site) lyase [Desulfurivibrio dismutans]|uniref:bifunctional DNA-formamidopyrimidine glycosylase/DNA-(apurinic or apyrimidinic site) lyase n=1 Tax=Desulfurivibrio dismutans TaxID=1398908 RepID=UPI0023DA9E96|nr:bifunctional DNA-formamidopyrimidine glycosylase/DNA-(apurinic or apyrimidinic site) lyase [Desulfurivibrio alkaliphilus]MDF1615095.1 bifunctional DNA-formamidopyrimidine glycosylase/DNA-(apurinic or apyrimidinic site) lyase [Desulfurivibrio alkaliphilus]
MPELPEVEVVRQGLEPLVLNRQIARISASGLPLRRPVPLAELCQWGEGARVTGVARRAKYLLLHLDNGALMIFHLGMTGKIYPATSREPARKHDHLVLHLAADRGPAGSSNLQIMEPGEQPPVIEAIRFNDCRRFGLVAVFAPAEAAAPPLLAGLGPEPLDEKAFSPAYLALACAHRRTPIKNLLMDNKVVVGIGNIYASEVLFAAGVHPETLALAVSRPKLKKICAAARQILTRAIAAGGTTIVDFANAAGESGYFQVQLAVYGRAGQPCCRCGREIARTVQAGRATYFCPRCQRRAKPPQRRQP